MKGRAIARDQSPIWSSPRILICGLEDFLQVALNSNRFLSLIMTTALNRVNLFMHRQSMLRHHTRTPPLDETYAYFMQNKEIARCNRYSAP